MRHQEITGIILRKARTKENDAAVVVFSKELGKVFCVAKGAQKITSRRVTSLDTCNVVRIQLLQYHSVWYIQEIDLISRLQIIKVTRQRDYLILLTEVLDKLLSYEQNEEKVYGEVVQTLKTLSGSINSQTFMQSVSRILSLLGYEKGVSFHNSLASFIDYIQTVTEREVKSRHLIS